MSTYYYSSVQNVRKIMRKLPSSVTDEDILYHMERADAVINARLAGSFKVPFIDPPVLIEKVSTDLTIYFLAETLYSSQQPNLDEYQERRYVRSMEWLDDFIATDIDSRGSDYATTNDQQIFTYEEPYW
jgi:phage gp36-like protein